jgi:hypothetical protein
MPFVTTDIPIFWQEYTGNFAVKIPEIEKRHLNGDKELTKYVVAIDASESFVGSARASYPEDRVGKVRDVILDLLGKDGAIGSSIGEGDILEPRTLAGTAGKTLTRVMM